MQKWKSRCFNYENDTTTLEEVTFISFLSFYTACFGYNWAVNRRTPGTSPKLAYYTAKLLILHLLSVHLYLHTCLLYYILRSDQKICAKREYLRVS